MKQDQVTIGMQARVKIGSRVAEVKVLRRLSSRGRGRARYECRTADTGRLVRATAAGLRPMPPREVDATVTLDADVAGEPAWAGWPVGAEHDARGLEAWEAWAAAPVGAW